MKVGDKVKIVKGTHKNKWGYVFLLKEHFVQVRTQQYTKSKAKGDSEDVIVEKVVRAKREFVIEVPELIIEMPNEDQVQVVPDLPDDYELPKISEADNDLVAQILADMPLPPNDDDILSQYDEEEEPVDIAAVLPTTDETLALQKTCDSQGNKIHELEDQLVKMGLDRAELYEACDMFMKCADYIKGRIDALDPAVE
jgi:ribosomal protein L24